MANRWNRSRSIFRGKLLVQKLAVNRPFRPLAAFGFTRFPFLTTLPSLGPLQPARKDSSTMDLSGIAMRSFFSGMRIGRTFKILCLGAWAFTHFAATVAAEEFRIESKVFSIKGKEESLISE